jgi:hypothetical protein
MCASDIGSLTLASMLTDPLIQAMRHSDGVSDSDYASLLFRVKDALSGREDRPWPVVFPEPEWGLADA